MEADPHPSGPLHPRPGQPQERQRDQLFPQAALGEVDVERGLGRLRPDPAVELARGPAGPEGTHGGTAARCHQHRQLGHRIGQRRLRFEQEQLRAAPAERLGGQRRAPQRSQFDIEPQLRPLGLHGPRHLGSHAVGGVGHHDVQRTAEPAAIEPFAHEASVASREIERAAAGQPLAHLAPAPARCRQEPAAIEPVRQRAARLDLPGRRQIGAHHEPEPAGGTRGTREGPVLARERLGEQTRGHRPH